MVFDIGRICIKLAGRDAGSRCIIIDTLGNNRVLVDGETRRRPCNIGHLEPTGQTLDIAKNAPHDAVLKALNAIETKGAKKKAAPRPKRVRKTVAPAAPKAAARPAAAKAPAKAAVKPAKADAKTVAKAPAA